MKSRRHRLLPIVSLAVIILVIAGVVLLKGSRTALGGAATSDVDLERIIDFAKRSNSAYHEEKDFRNEYGPHIERGEFPASGLRVYLDRNPTGDAQWVILRGTANLADVLDDLDFVGRDQRELGINVHEGFDRALQECLPWILERLDPQRPIWVTGHSLGGAVAALLVATLDHRGFKNVSAITFGQPKFTDAHGAERLAHLKILRIVHDEDPIPMLPPVDVEGTSLAIYHHCGPEVLVGAGGHLVFVPVHSAARMEVSRIWQDLKNVRPMSHDMIKGYLPALKGALASTLKVKPTEGSSKIPQQPDPP